MSRSQFVLDLARKIAVNYFAGGGGTSEGYRRATGRDFDVAVNHNLEAMIMHQANHPQTRHYPDCVWKVDPVVACRGRQVGFAWFSPDCTHFSKAKGSKPLSKEIRGLAGVMPRFARLVRPDVMMLENVEEFPSWGPLDEYGRPDPLRKGEDYRDFTADLDRECYRWETAVLRACDYGAPTIRKRFFMIARCDGKPIVWPEPTHGDPKSEAVKSGRLKPWRAAAECVDFTIPCPSIFLSKEEGKKIRVQRPLVPRSESRFAKGVGRYVIHAKEPFIVFLNGEGGAEVVSPFVTYAQQGGRSRPASAPFHCLTASPKDQNQVCAVHLARQFGTAIGQPVLDPLKSLMAGGGGGKTQVIASFLAQNNTGMVGHPASAPFSTFVGRGTVQSLIACSLVSYYGTDQDARLDEPMPSATTKDRFAVAASSLAIPPLTPELAVRARMVAAFLRSYGIEFEGEFATCAGLIIYDIGMRMFRPREMFRGQGFDDSYIIDPIVEYPNGKKKRLSATAQTRMCGNSVCPDMAEALIRANLPDMCIGHRDYLSALAA